MRNILLAFALVLIFFTVIGLWVFKSVSLDFLSNQGKRNDPNPVARSKSKGSPTLFLSSGELVIPLEWHGVWTAKVVINDLHEANLIIDSGATYTTISEELAFNIGLSENTAIQKFDMETANGRTPAWIGRLSSLRVGEIQRENLAVAVLDFNNDRRSTWDGVLGLNFLQDYTWRLDQHRGHLIITSEN